MTTDTWGELLDDAAWHIRHGTHLLKEPFPSSAAAAWAVAEHDKVHAALAANLHVLGAELARTQAGSNMPTRFDDLAEHSHVHLEDSASAVAWHRAADCLYAAADVLGSHLGPDRAYRTPDTVVLDDAAERSLAVERLSQIHEMASEARRHLALRVHEAAIAHGSAALDRWARQALDGPASNRSAAGFDRGGTRSSPEGAITGLYAAPLLRPTTCDDPIAAARQSFDRIRLIAHRQARSELPAGVDALATLVGVGLTVTMHAHALTAAASTVPASFGDAARLRETGAALLAAREPWLSAGQAVNGCVSLRRSPALLRHEATVLKTSLEQLTRADGGWQSAAVMLGDPGHRQRLVGLAQHFTGRLPDLARSAAVVHNELHRSGAILAPTRERDDIDHPYRWAPLGSQRVNAIRAALATVEDATRDAAAAAPPTCSRDAVLTIERKRTQRTASEPVRTAERHEAARRPAPYVTL